MIGHKKNSDEETMESATEKIIVTVKHQNSQNWKWTYLKRVSAATIVANALTT